SDACECSNISNISPERKNLDRDKTKEHNAYVWNLRMSAISNSKQRPIATSALDPL
ncbi:13745_t:CDS:1, partial [Cetraspora pellucida]